MGVRPVIDKVAKQVLLDVRLLDLIGETICGHTSTHFNSGDAADNICGKLLSSHFLVTPIAVFIHCRDAESIASDYVETKMEEQMNAQIPN